MTWPRRPSSPRELRTAVVFTESAISLPPLSIMLFYLGSLLDLSASEWRGFALALLGYALLSGLGLEPLRRRIESPLHRYLAAGAAADDRMLREAFACSMRLPRTLMRVSLATWAAAAFFLSGVMGLAGFPGWIAGDRMVGVFVSAITGGLITMTFEYFAIKRVVAPLREELADAIPDPEERRALAPLVPLARKLQYVVAGSAVASLMFTSGLAYEGAASVLVDLARGEQARALDAVVRVLPGGTLERAEHVLWPDPSLAPRGLRLAMRERDALAGRFAAIDHALEVGEARGVLDDQGVLRGDIAAWHALPDGRVVLAQTPRAQVLAPLSSLRTTLFGVLVVACALCFAVVGLLADDVRRSLGALRAGADRMASGDLRVRRLVESEDELGELARAFEKMATALRATVERVAETADRVDAAAAEIAGVSDSVSVASVDQVRRVAQASELMSRIRSEVEGIAAAAQQLGASVEESNSSVLEIGAAGEDLNETAGALAERVDEVSHSVEEMVRSVRQVAVTSSGLSDAACETSASMEAIARGMKSVDDIAEQTGALATDVLTTSEAGLDRVRETIEGMHEIRDATDTAEEVIRSLGRRSAEIGTILDVIDHVGDETTLLALNAAIIAAQAGEHGRAFSVVAGEIKDLARRVLDSTREIAGVVGALQEEAERAVSAIDQGSQRVARGVELAAEAGLSLEAITRSAHESGDHTERIVHAVREQVGAVGHVVGLMERVQAGVEEIRAAGSEQDRGNEVVFRSSMAMREVATQLRNTTEEQARGGARIRESIDGVRTAVTAINRAIKVQSESNSELARFLERVTAETAASEQSAQRMEASTRVLIEQSEALHEDVQKFQV